MKIPSPTIEHLIWDDWNLEHIKKHNVTPAEVEEAVVLNTYYEMTYKNRLLVIGHTLVGNVLAVVIGESPDVPDHWYVFSARSASRKERARFGEAMVKKEGGSS